MHPNPVFRGEAEARHLAFARDRGFGVLTAAGPDGVLAAHVPFLLSDDASRVECHLVRSNPLVRRLREDTEILLIVSGPDGYVSPDWYGVEDQVPTWNYVAVHLRGTARLREEGALRGHLDGVSAMMEGRIGGKTPWTMDKMTPEVAERMMRTIVPVEIDVASVDGTWKLNQNKTPEARLGAAERMETSPAGMERAALAALMRGV